MTYKMRLINTPTLTLHEFFGTNIPEYCILSHRWETEEVTFQDLQAGRGPGMKGYSKIVGCCKQAVLDSWEYAWIDSCCIDKTSSAELSEAINSMCMWYRRAQVCYAYLSDVPSIKDRTGGSSALYLSNSKWFTRGWTLQELLAPEYVVFYDKIWEEIGTKSSLADVIQSITGIEDLVRWEESCVAQKMSWASRRETTRIEDMAYSLMGIFGVYMPPLYGEGENAFIRLQLEIINKYDDESIFAWTSTSNYAGEKTGVLAASPKKFRACGNIEVTTNPDSTRLYREKPYSITNLGLRLEDAIVQADLSTTQRIASIAPNGDEVEAKDFSGNGHFPFHRKASDRKVFLMPLNCIIPGKRRNNVVFSITLVLEKIFGDHFVVLRSNYHLITGPIKGVPHRLGYVKQIVLRPPRETWPSLSVSFEELVSDSEVKLGFDPNGPFFYWGRNEVDGFNLAIGQESFRPVFLEVIDSACKRVITVLVEVQNGCPSIHLLHTQNIREEREAWQLYKATSAYRQGADRASLLLPGGTTVLASLRRVGGRFHFKVGIKTFSG